MIGRASLMLALATWPALAQEASDLAPESAPAPAIRPEEPQDPAPDEPTGEEGAETGTAEPEPEVEEEEPPSLIPPGTEPSSEAPTAAPETTTPDSADEGAEPERPEPAGPSVREALAESPDELSACLAELDTLGVAHEPSDPVTEPDNADCGMANPVVVTALAPGVALEPPSLMRCATALAAARWVSDVVVPMSRKLGRGEVSAIDQGTAYLCRPRADGEMSEHAFGNALDVMGFRFSGGEPIPVQPRAGDGTLEEAFQRAVRAGACLDFTTVLGPGSDADHADHLHFDIRQRDGGFRICE